MSEENMIPGTDKEASANPKAEKFREVATRRVNAACHAIDLLDNLTNANYSSTKEQRDKIVAIIAERVEVIRAHYAEFDQKAEKPAPKSNYIDL